MPCLLSRSPYKTDPLRQGKREDLSLSFSLYTMAAAIGVSSYPCSKTLTGSNPKSNQSRRIATPFLRSSNERLSSSSSSNLYGDKLHTRAVFGKDTKTAFGSRTPVLVSPKAVSDSQNSQTCLDPDASRVSTALVSSFLQWIWFGLCDFKFWSGFGEWGFVNWSNWFFVLVGLGFDLDWIGDFEVRKFLIW